MINQVPKHPPHRVPRSASLTPKRSEARTKSPRPFRPRTQPSPTGIEGEADDGPSVAPIRLHVEGQAPGLQYVLESRPKSFAVTLAPTQRVPVVDVRKDDRTLRSQGWGRAPIHNELRCGHARSGAKGCLHRQEHRPRHDRVTKV